MILLGTFQGCNVFQSIYSMHIDHLTFVSPWGGVLCHELNASERGCSCSPSEYPSVFSKFSFLIMQNPEMVPATYIRNAYEVPRFGFCLQAAVGISEGITEVNQ